MYSEKKEKSGNLKILIVEDDEMSRDITARYLEEYGRCDTAEDGEVAMKMFSRAREEGEPYNVVFLDILMPGMSGRKVLEKIREIEDRDNNSESCRAKIIMTSSLSDPGTISGAFRSRCEAYLVKPFGREELEKQLQTLDVIKSS